MSRAVLRGFLSTAVVWSPWLTCCTSTECSLLWVEARTLILWSLGNSFLVGKEAMQGVTTLFLGLTEYPVFGDSRSDEVDSVWAIGIDERDWLTMIDLCCWWVWDLGIVEYIERECERWRRVLRVWEGVWKFWTLAISLFLSHYYHLPECSSKILSHIFVIVPFSSFIL